MKHETPILREVFTFKPNMALSRQNAIQIVDLALELSSEFVSAIKNSCLSVTNADVQFATVNEREEARRRQTRTEILDLPEIVLSGTKYDIKSRTCITACSARLGSKRHHKVWTRLNLIQTGGQSPKNMSVADLVEYYLVASELSEAIAKTVMDSFKKVAANLVADLDYEQSSRLSVKFFDSAADDVRSVALQLAKGHSVTDVVKDSGGQNVFSGILAVENQTSLRDMQKNDVNRPGIVGGSNS